MFNVAVALQEHDLECSPSLRFEGLWTITGSGNSAGVGRSQRHALMWYWINNNDPKKMLDAPEEEWDRQICPLCGLVFQQHPPDNRIEDQRVRFWCDGRRLTCTTPA